ncbi:MAG: FecR family protein [Opitutaceae bacterium]
MSTRKPLPLYDAPEPIMRQAGAWLARRDRGLTADEKNEFDAWLRANPCHAAAVLQLERTMSAFDRLRELAPREGAMPDRDTFTPARPSPRWFRPALVAAGMAAAFVVVFWSIRHAPAPATWRYATAPGGYERVTLVDGSSVELNASTILEVEYTAADRRARLSRGEAHFQVAKDSARPFVVRAGMVAVRAVGTGFNVRLEQAGVEVLVTEGRVQVEPPAPATGATSASASSPVPPVEIPLLTAGQRIRVATADRAEPAKIAAVSSEEIKHALAWQQRVAEFGNTPLRAVVAEFNRQNRQQIVIRDPGLEALRIGGNFRADQPEAFVRLLESSFGIVAERSGEIITLRKAPVESP